jgi:hypothetical protein
MAQIADRLLAGRYRLNAPLGRGGMGVVWYARDELLRRDVAVKEIVLPPELTPLQRYVLRERTLREARAAARISSPSAVTIYDVVVDGGQPWIVMQKLAPRTLADVLRDDGALPPAQVARIGLWLLDALSAAHRAGVLHRDVKPANVMFSEDGRAVLTDFGIATVEGDSSLTTAGVLIGSPAYMAPERARGEPPTAASDLWSLGATLYAALEGESPFQRDGQLPTLTAIVSDDLPPAPRAGALAPVVERLLTKDPSRRPDAAELRLLLTRAAADLAPAPPGRAPAPPRDPGTAPTPTAPAPRLQRRGLIGALAAILLVGLAAVGAYVVLFGQTGDRTGEHEQRSGGTVRSSPSGGPTNPAVRTPQRTASAGGPATASPKRRASAAAVAAVPAGFTLYRDPTGFRIAVPDGWTRSTQGTRTYFREKGGGRFLQVDQTTDPKPDALADWRSQEEIVSQRLAGYERIRIEPVDYRGWNAADWEFTWRTTNGRLHVLSRNIRVSDERAYALYWSTPVGQWEESRRYFDVFARTFQPAA